MHEAGLNCHMAIVQMLMKSFANPFLLNAKNELPSNISMGNCFQVVKNYQDFATDQKYFLGKGDPSDDYEKVVREQKEFDGELFELDHKHHRVFFIAGIKGMLRDSSQMTMEDEFFRDVKWTDESGSVHVAQKHYMKAKGEVDLFRLKN